MGLKPSQRQALGESSSSSTSLQIHARLSKEANDAHITFIDTFRETIALSIWNAAKFETVETLLEDNKTLDITLRHSASPHNNALEMVVEYPHRFQRGAEGDQTKLIELLLRAGEFDPTEQNLMNDTALHMAVGNGSSAVVQLLVDTGQCDFTVKNAEGKTPLECAIDLPSWEKGKSEVISILEKAMGLEPSHALDAESKVARMERRRLKRRHSGVSSTEGIPEGFDIRDMAFDIEGIKFAGDSPVFSTSLQQSSSAEDSDSASDTLSNS